MIALLLLACQTTTHLEGDFDAPWSVAVLDPSQGGPFREPLGLVTNQRSGTIVALDLKHGWLMSDDGGAAFLDPDPTTTGRARMLTEIVARAEGAAVSAWVADELTESLLEVPIYTGVDESGFPIEPVPTLVGEVVSSSGKAELQRLELRAGGATTEDWTFTFDGEAWQMEGTRSGLQALPCPFRTPCATTHGELEIFIDGEAEVGDTLTFSVDTGVVEHDLGGPIEALHYLSDSDLLLAAIFDPSTGETRAQVVELEGVTVLGTLALPAGAHPARFASDGTRLWIADARDGAIYAATLGSDSPELWPVETISAPWPVSDLAWQGEEGSYDHLFVAAAGANEVGLYDLGAGAWVDLNPSTAELDPLRFNSPVTGLAAAPDPVLLPETGSDGAQLEERVVAISLGEGALYIAEGSSGCLARDQLGPYAWVDTVSLDQGFHDKGSLSDPVLELAESSGRDVTVNACGGLAKDEIWTIAYDESLGTWHVEGSESGRQEGRAREGERYVSDRGEISFLIHSGQYPSTTGDYFDFRVEDGVIRVDGDLDGNPAYQTAGEVRIEAPGRPAAWSAQSGPSGGGWDVQALKVGVAWPNTNGGNVLKIDLSSGELDAVWD